MGPFSGPVACNMVASDAMVKLSGPCLAPAEERSAGVGAIDFHAQFPPAYGRVQHQPRNLRVQA